MGTPGFAVPSLDKLLMAGYNIVGVVTAPDKPAGRGMSLQQSAIKIFALEQGLKILQPEKLKDESFLKELKSLHADVQIVVAFRMLPEVVWNMPAKGTINLHGSLLPQYRGAAPINWVIINGEKETGVTTFKLQHQIDTGNILLQKKILIGDTETSGELHDKMKIAGAELLAYTLQRMEEGTLKELPQKQFIVDHSQMLLKQAPRLTEEMANINWDKSVDDVYNLIRGLSPYPAAFTLLNNKKLKIFTAQKEITRPLISAGEFETDKKTFLKFACANGYILVLELQLAGKKKMSIEEFLRGYRF